MSGRSHRERQSLILSEQDTHGEEDVDMMAGIKGEAVCIH